MRSLSWNPRRVRAGRVTAAVTAVLAGAVLVASLGVGGAAAAPATASKACTGTPVVVLTDANLSNMADALGTDVGQGAEAAAAQITKTCELGAPLHVVSCDDQYSPNGATSCGNDAVTDKAMAVMEYTCCGDNVATPVVAAGIPVLPITETSSLETSSPLSFAFGESLPQQYSAIQLAKAAGATKIAIVAIDIPEVTFLTNLIQTQATKLGLASVIVTVPPTATDMTSYTEQVISDGANAVIPIIPNFQVVAMVKDIKQLGSSLSKVRVVNVLFNSGPSIIKQIGDADAKGLLIGGWSLPTTETSAAPVKEYLKELAADHQPKPPDSLGLTAWAEVHVLADSLKAEHLAPTAANAKTAMSTNASMPKLTVHYGLVPYNFTHNAFPNDPVLSKLRIFTSYSYDYEVNGKGVLVPLFKGHPVNALAGALAPLKG